MKKPPKEILGLILMLTVGLVPRLAFIIKYPTIPFSDFAALVAFGRFIRLYGLFANEAFWEYFNPGMPLVLSVLFRIVPGDPGTVARWATAIVCGLLPAIPFLIWRGVMPLWVRLLAGGMLGLWPGQIVFSGVVAQDNWVMIPTVGLAALAIRRLLAHESGRPILAGLLLAAGAAIRQEMLVVLLPLFLATAGVTLRAGWRRVATAGLAAGLPLLAMAAYRGVVTGRFSLNTEHGGLSVLGAYIPGATANGWTDPYPYIASVRPDLLRDRKALMAELPKVAFQEAVRRPKFQVVRILSMMCTGLVGGEFTSMYWSVGAAEVLPPNLHERGNALVLSSAKWLYREMAGIHGLFVAALMIGIWQRNRAILVVGAAVLLKFAIHAIVAAQGRYFFASTAMEMPAIAVAAYEVWPMVSTRRWLVPATALILGILAAGGLLVARPHLLAWSQSLDVDYQRSYRFPLKVADHHATINCEMNRGVLLTLALPRDLTQAATIRTFSGDPPWGDAATAVCELTGTGDPRPLYLQVLDPYAPGGFPDRMLQRVEVDGVEVFSHDLAKDPGSGWARIPLGNVGAGTSRKVVVEVKAVRPDPGPGWGNAAVTTFELAR